MELVKNVKTHGNNGQNGWTRKQHETTTLSEPTSVDIDAVDTDMHARPGDADTLAPGPGFCTTAFFLCATQRQSAVTQVVCNRV